MSTGPVLYYHNPVPAMPPPEPAGPPIMFPRSPSAFGFSVAVAFSLALVPPPAAADLVLGLCDAGTVLPGVIRQQSFYDASGQSMILALTAEAQPADACESLSVPGNAATLRWFGPVAAATAGAAGQTGYRIQGVFADLERYRVSEVDALGGRVAGPAPRLRFAENLLPRSDAVVFGRDERAAWLGGNQLQCQGGNNPAGVQFRSQTSWPTTDDAQLLIEASGRGEFQIAVADRARIASQQPLSLGTLALANSEQPVTRHFPLPGGSSDWRALTIGCPPQSGDVQFHNVAVLPGRTGSGGNLLRTLSAWLWSPRLWQQDAAMLWRIVSEQQLQEIYLTIPVTDDGALPTAELRGFLAEAASRDIRVWPVIGDRRDVLQESWPALRNRISAYARFNADFTADSADATALAGVQLDIEPYLLSGFGLNPAYWRERYLETIAFARGVVGPFLPIDLAVPVWWGSHPDFGADFLARLAPYQVSLTIMNYRTNVQQLQAGAEPFLSWGETYNRRVSIGLEAGSLPDEWQRLYRPEDDAGPLWQLQLGDQALLVLYEAPVSGLSGQAFRLQEERPFAASNLSFQGNLQRLQTVAGFLNSSLDHWPSFRGVNLHGLDEVYREQNAN